MLFYLVYNRLEIIFLYFLAVTITVHIRHTNIANAGIPIICIEIDWLISPCKSKIRDLPSPQPMQCSKPTALSGQSEK
jgi:hypothetical protein